MLQIKLVSYFINLAKWLADSNPKKWSQKNQCSSLRDSVKSDLKEIEFFIDWLGDPNPRKWQSFNLLIKVQNENRKRFFIKVFENYWIRSIFRSKVIAYSIIVLLISLSIFWIEKHQQGSLADVMDSLEAIAIVTAAVIFALEGKDRQKRNQYEAWRVVNESYGQPGNGGRTIALQDLNDEGVILEGVAAPRADLSKINLSGAKLERSNFRKAKLCHANLRDADLTNADLREANLENACLAGAILYGAKLDRANLREANLENCCLNKATLEGAILVKASFNNADLSEAILQKAVLIKASLVQANCWHANFKATDLRESNLKGAILDGADLESTNLKGAILENAVLSFANLQGSDFEGATLKGADLKGAFFEDSVFVNAEGRLLTIKESGHYPVEVDIEVITSIELTPTNLEEVKNLPEFLKRHFFENESSERIIDRDS